jgi:hypothetical protein
VVEGFRTKSQKRVGDRIGISQHVLGRNAQDLNALAPDPLGPHLIALRPITSVMRKPIHLDRQLCRWAIEVQNIRPNRVLAPKPHLCATQPDPQQFLRQRQFAPKPPRILVSFVCRARR